MAVEPENGLLTRAANGETDALRELYDAHHAAMYRFAYRLTGAVDVADDITQESFLRLMRSPGFDRERGSLCQYLYGIVRSLARQRQQSNGREVYWDEDVEGGLNSAVVPCPDPAASAELTAPVQAAILGLPPLQREAIVLSLIPHDSYPFQKAGVISGFGISFSWNGDNYEFRSRSAITESSGNWNLYVLAAPTMAESNTDGFSFGAVNSVEEFLSKAQ